MSKSYDKVTKTLNSQPPKQMPADIVTSVTQNRASIIIDTEVEQRAVLGNKNDPIDTPEEIAETRYTP
jgi:hypothetical protein